MSSLTKTNYVSGSSSDTFSHNLTRKRSNSFSQGETIAPALRSTRVETYADEPINEVSTRIIRSKSENPNLSKALHTKSFAVISESQPTEISLETKKRKNDSNEKNMRKMIANSEKAFQEHVIKENSSTSIFAPARAIVDQSELPPIHIKHFSAERQGIRETMEDTSFFEKVEGGYVAGTFDGHGGNGVAKIASETFPEVFSAAFKNKEGDVYKAMHSTIQTIHQRAITEKSLEFVGSTAVVSFISDSGTIYTATVGDSEAFHYHNDEKGKIKSTPLSIVRNWSSEGEARRAARLANTEKERVRRESWVGYPESKQLRVQNPTGLSLNLSNSLGDLTYKEVSQKSVITVDQIGEKAIVGYFCDGVTDFVSQKEVVDLIKEGNQPKNLAKEITNYAITTKQSTDNTTALLLFISRKDKA